MKTAFSIFLILYTFSLKAYSDKESKTSETSKKDTNYIDELKGIHSLKLYTQNRTNSFIVTNPDETLSANFEPNTASALGLSVVYKWLKFGFTFLPLGKQGPESTHGKTNKIDIQTHIFTDKIGVDLSFQLYNGFYLSNPSTFYNDWEQGQDYPLRPDIVTASFGAGVYYVFNNDKFSLQSTYIQSEWQKKSAGSLVLGANLNTFLVVAQTSITPGFYAKTSREDAIAFNAVRSRSTSPLVGYSYTLVVNEHIFTNLTLSPKVALTHVTLINATTEHVYKKRSIKGGMEVRFGLGYNSRKFFGGFLAEYNFQQYTLSESQGSIQYTRGQASFYAGYRFGRSQ